MSLLVSTSTMTARCNAREAHFYAPELSERLLFYIQQFCYFFPGGIPLFVENGDMFRIGCDHVAFEGQGLLHKEIISLAELIRDI